MEISSSEINEKIQERIKKAVNECNSSAKSCALRASNELRNAALNVLRGQRSGKVYRKYPYSSTYTASAPGEAPAVRTGMLRMSWGIDTTSDGKGNFTAGIYSDVKYAPYLDNGTRKMAARPYKQKIIDTAKPKVVQIFSTLKTK